MEPRRQEQQPSKTQSNWKPKRFRIVKLEERIAPGNGGTHGNKVTCHSCHLGCGTLPL
jgi:hypothetical protein